MTRNINVKILVLFLILISFLVLIISNRDFINQLNAPDINFELKFDEFDDRMEICHGWENGGYFDCTWSKENVKFENGIMNLTINKDENENYTGGEYRSNETFGYGYYKVKMKPIKNDGVVSSFFVYTGESNGTQWDEIDIEFLGKDTTKVQFNYYTNGVGKHEYIYDLNFDASEDFHTYGFEWMKDSISWYVDGKLVHRVDSDIPHTPGKIMMNVWPGKNVDKWLNPYDGKTPITAEYSSVEYSSKWKKNFFE